MKSKKLLIAAATLAMIGAASVGPAMAYFTDSQYAYGFKRVDLGDTKLDPKEELDETQTIKTITVTNTGNYDVWVRVNVFSGVSITPEGVDPEEGAKWTAADNDGYYVYKEVLKAGETTSPIKFKVNLPKLEQVTNDTQPEYNVIIVEEATRVTYEENGQPIVDDVKDEAGNIIKKGRDWNLSVDSTRVETKTSTNPQGGDN